MIKVGCCGFRGKRKDYFKGFEVVEIQQTFYKLPKIETAKRWKKEAPSYFEWTMKALQLITHEPSSPTYRKAGIKIEKEKNYGFFKPTDEVFKAWERCEEFAKALKAKMIIFQCPPSFNESKENIKNIKQFFSSISRNFIYVLELRGKWKDKAIAKICEDLNLIHCVDPFKMKSLYGEIKYYRLHGIGGYKYDYSKEELKKLADICKKDDDVYCLFNNTQMLKNALEFKEILKQNS